MIPWPLFLTMRHFRATFYVSVAHTAVAVSSQRLQAAEPHPRPVSSSKAARDFKKSRPQPRSVAYRAAAAGPDPKLSAPVTEPLTPGPIDLLLLENADFQIYVYERLSLLDHQ